VWVWDAILYAHIQATRWLSSCKCGEVGMRSGCVASARPCRHTAKYGRSRQIMAVQSWGWRALLPLHTQHPSPLPTLVPAPSPAPRGCCIGVNHGCVKGVGEGQIGKESAQHQRGGMAGCTARCCHGSISRSPPFSFELDLRTCSIACVCPSTSELPCTPDAPHHNAR